MSGEVEDKQNDSCEAGEGGGGEVGRTRRGKGVGRKGFGIDGSNKPPSRAARPTRARAEMAMRGQFMSPLRAHPSVSDNNDLKNSLSSRPTTPLSLESRRRVRMPTENNGRSFDPSKGLGRRSDWYHRWPRQRSVRISGNNDAGGGRSGYCQSADGFEPPPLQQAGQFDSPPLQGSGNNIHGEGSSSGGGNTSEDDLIEAEIQRLL